MELEANRERAPDRSSNGLKDTFTAICSQHGTPSNRKRTGRPPISDDDEKARRPEIRIEMDHVVRDVMISLGYHERVPRTKFGVKPDSNPKKKRKKEEEKKRVAWCQARLHWTKEEWKRVIRTDESSFSNGRFRSSSTGHPEKQMKNITPTASI